MKKYLIILSGFLLISCHQEQNLNGKLLGSKEMTHADLSMDEQIEPPRTSEPQEPPNGEEINMEKGSKIIKNGDMIFEVTDLEKSKIKIDALLKRNNGYYESENYNSYGDRNNFSLQIRLASENFDSLVVALESGIGKLTSKNIRADDVTEEYVDLRIRLNNKLSYLEQYKSLLKKAKTIEELLEVQYEIRKLEEEIESKKGRLKYIDDQVKYSTLYVEISEYISRDIHLQPHFGIKLLNAFKGGFSFFLGFLIGLVSIWPFLLLILIILLNRNRIWSLFVKR